MKKEFEQQRNNSIALNPNFGEEIIDMEWQKVRYFTKAMWLKYQKDRKEGNLKFENYVELARAYWKIHMNRILLDLVVYMSRDLLQHE